MHGFSSGSTSLVNAEVDYMGGVVDGGVGIGISPSPRKAAIEKAQAELRLEYDVREERRRELEFLEKGGNPLDFRFGLASSVSVQSTSHTDQHPDQNLTSEAKGSFALTTSPQGDSVESSGRLGVTRACEPNSADNFDGGNEILQNVRKSMHSGRGNINLPEHSSQLAGSLNVKEVEDSPIFHPKKGQAYRRRNRSRINRDGTRSSSADMASRGGHGSTPGRHGMLPLPVASENQFEMKSDGTNILHSSMISRASDLADEKLKLSTTKDQLEELQILTLKADEPSVSIKLALVAGNDIDNEVVDHCPYSNAEKIEDNGTSTAVNVTGNKRLDDKHKPPGAPINVGLKGLDSELTCTQANVSVDVNGNVDCVINASLNNVDINRPRIDFKLAAGENSVCKDDILPNEQHIDNAMETACTKGDQIPIGQHGDGFTEKDHCEVDRIKSPSKKEAKSTSDVEEQAHHEHTETKSEKVLGQLDNCASKLESSCVVRPLRSVDPFPSGSNRKDLVTSYATVSQACSENQQKQLEKAQEDTILEEARIIEAKRKQIAELSISVLPSEHQLKSHWDFVVDEMGWLANDFAQERLWKMTAAAQICYRVAFAARMRLEEQSKSLKHKSVAHNLTKAVMEFWQSARLSAANKSSQQDTCNAEALSEAEEIALTKDNTGNFNKDKVPQDELQSTGRPDCGIYKYAVEFLRFNSSSKPLVEVEVPETPSLACDMDYPDVSWNEQFTEESLFYVVPPGALEIYRKSIESCLADSEKFGSVIREEVDTSAYDAAVVGYQKNDYEEDEGENLYYLPGTINTGKQSKKKRKSMKSYAARLCEGGGDYGYAHCMENKNMSPHSVVIGKRPVHSPHVDPIPTKRMRTASRQRVVGPFIAGPAGVAPVLSRADTSSGDTNSYQDDQSILHGESASIRGSEVNSTMNYEKQSTFDSAELLAKPKKKKKIKYQSTPYHQRWPPDSSMQIDQKDVRKQFGSHQLESNGHSGLRGQHAKKPKLIKHSVDTSFDNTLPMNGSMASPVASQMSNMSSQSKINKLIGGRDRASKSKGFKVSNGQLGSGSPWTVVEDQALVVLVHDMGPNWELVSDAMNCILQFKCIFRKPQECKDRHKFLMDRPSGDGADSAEDSGSSQPYPSTLPGIPKGSARQLFRSLHAALEEDNIKSHFEKIIYIEQQLHYRKKQVENQDLKQIAPIHSSHVTALTQVIPNNVNGGILTPLDFCDVAVPNQDPLSIGYNSHSGGFPLPNQGSISPMHPPSGLNSPLPGLQGSPSMGIANNLASPSSNFTGSRDARYAGPRSSSLPLEEQHRLHQYNSMHPGRNVLPSNLSSSGSFSGNDKGFRMLPSGNGVSIMPGMSRPVPVARPGFQGVPSSSMLNSGSVHTSNISVMPNNMNVHSGAAAGQGKTSVRPRDALHMARPGQSSEHQRLMVLPEMQMQATQTSSPGAPSFGGLSSGYSNQTTSPPLQTYAGHQQQQHPVPQQHSHLQSSPHPHLPTSKHSTTPDQAAYLRIARERQLQQRLLQRQHRQHPASSALMTHAQSSSQIPLSSPLQNSSQVQSPSSQHVSLSSSSQSSPVTHVPLQSQQQPQQKHPLPPHGLGRSAQSGAGGLVNQMGKQRPRQAQQLQQQYQQSGRQHPQQCQPSLSQQSKANTGSQVAEKGESTQPLVQGQGTYSGSCLNTLPASKSLASSTKPQKFANVDPTSTQSAQQSSSHLNNGSQGQSPAAPSSPVVSLNQCISASAPPSSNHQQLQGQPHSSMNVLNQSQPGFLGAIQLNRQVNPDALIKSQGDISLAEQRSSNSGSVPACVDSSGAISVSSSSTSAMRKVQGSVCDSAMTSVSSSSGPSSSQAVSNSLGIEPTPSVSEGHVQRQFSGNLASHGHGSQRQNQSSQLQSASPVPVLLPKQSQQPLQKHEQLPLKVHQHQIQSGQSSVFTNTTNSRLE